MINDLGARRAALASDNLDISPRDILALVIEDLQSGEVIADGILIVCVHRPVNKPWKLSRYRAGLSRDQEVVLTCLSYESTMSNWLQKD